MHKPFFWPLTPAPPGGVVWTSHSAKAWVAYKDRARLRPRAFLFLSLRTAGGYWWRDLCNCWRLTLDRRRLALSRRRLADDQPQLLAGRRSAKVRASRRPELHYDGGPRLHFHICRSHDRLAAPHSTSVRRSARRCNPQAAMPPPMRLYK